MTARKLKKDEMVYLRKDLEMGDYYGGIKFLSDMKYGQENPVRVVQDRVGMKTYKIRFECIDFYVSEEMIDFERTNKITEGDDKMMLNAEVTKGVKVVIGSKSAIKDCKFDYNEDMFKYAGEVATVTAVRNSLGRTLIKLDIDEGRFSWCENSIATVIVEQEKPEKLYEAGDVVVLRKDLSTEVANEDGKYDMYVNSEMKALAGKAVRIERLDNERDSEYQYMMEDGFYYHNSMIDHEATANLKEVSNCSLEFGKEYHDLEAEKLYTLEKDDSCGRVLVREETDMGYTGETVSACDLSGTLYLIGEVDKEVLPSQFPRMGQEYFFVDSSRGEVRSYNWDDDSTDAKIKETVGVFKTREEAENVLRKMKIMFGQK